MTRTDRILSVLTELADESRTPQRMGAAYPGIERDVVELMPVHAQLKKLPKDISLPYAAKAALRAQLMANIRQAAFEKATTPWWRRAVDSVTDALSPGAFAQALARPAAMALAVTMSFTAAGVTTVSAAMESLPGDGLYPVKGVVERTVLAVQLDDEGRVDAHLWRAKLRLTELTRLVAAGQDASAEQVADQWNQHVGEARKTAQESVGDHNGLVGAIDATVTRDVKASPAEVQPRLLARVTPSAAGLAASSAATQLAAPPAQSTNAPQTSAATQPPAEVEPAISESASSPGGALPDTKGVSGIASGAKSAPTNDPKEPIAPPDPNAIPAKSGGTAPQGSPITGPIATKDQPTTPIEPAKADPVQSADAGQIPTKTEPAAPAQAPASPEPKPQTTTDPTGGLDGSKDNAPPSAGPGLGPKQ